MSSRVPKSVKKVVVASEPVAPTQLDASLIADLPNEIVYTENAPRRNDAETPTPGNPGKEREQTICITNHFNKSDRDCIDLPVSKVIDYLKSIKPNECCERTQPTEREPTRTYNRVYIDLDGVLPDTLTEQEFDSKTTAITEALSSADFPNTSLMESCKFRVNTGEGIKNKISWRLTYTRLHGEKEQIAQYVQSKFLSILKKKLLTIIPVVCKLAGEKNKKNTIDTTGSLEIDMSVYNKGNRKMRMLYQSKPSQKRPNRLIKGEPIDTIITYIPHDSVLLPKKVVIDERLPVFDAVIEHIEESNSVMGMTDSNASAYHEPTEDEVKTRELLRELLPHLNQSRFDYYPHWLRLGFVLYNEGFTVDEFIEISKRSTKYIDATSPRWIKEKWFHFRKSRLTQSTLWRWLSEDNPDAYHELVVKRKDFWTLMNCMSHAEVAQFFYNMKTDSYVFHELIGWYQLGNNNIWELYEKTPSMLKSDIWNTLKKVAKEHLQSLPKPEAPDSDCSEEDKEQYKEDMKIYKTKIKTIWKFVNSIGTSGFVDGVIQFLPSMYKFDELIAKMDESRNLLAFSNKVVDLDTMEVRDISPTDYISINTEYPYPEVRYPEVRQEIIQTLRSIFETDDEINTYPDSLGELTRYALEHICLSLCGNNKYEKIYIWTGKGGNGKGLLTEIVKRSFGKYFHPLPHTIITKPSDKKDSACPALAKAKGKRFVQFSEPEAEDKLQVGLIKELTGNDEITARDLFKSTIIYKPQFGLYGQTNNIPKLNRPDGGAGRRIRIIKFVFSFISNPTDPFHKLINMDLKDKIVKSPEWRDEFMLLLLETYDRLRGKTIHEPQRVLDDSKEYMEDNNPVGGWVMSNYDIGLDPNDRRWWIGANELKDRYIEDTKHQISAERFKGGMILCDIEQSKASHDFDTVIYDDYAKSYCDITRKAGRYWVGIRKKGQPLP
jgi:P4 family phage/plasmid primase-like protien